MKILVVSSYLPYPLHSGGHVRLYNILKHLSRHHEIILVCEKRSNQSEVDVQAVGKFCKEIYTYPRKRQWSISTILKTGFSSYPFLIVGHTNPAMKEKISQILQKEKIDIIHVETSYIMQNVPVTSVPIVLVEHNIEYFVYERFVQKAPVFLRPLLHIDVKKLKKWEQQFWQRATKLIAVSEEEKQEMKRSDVVVIPNGVDLEAFPYILPEEKYKQTERNILFIGNFKWLQNRDTVRFILKEVWGKIKSESGILNHELKLWIVGKHIPDSIQQLVLDQTVIFDENASDKTSDIFKNAFILLTPIRIGGGTSFKIIEAMASGVPVITSTLGAQGLVSHGGKEVIMSNTSEEIRSSLLDLLRDKKKYKELSQNARNLVEKQYNWKSITEKLEGVYKSVT
ncbi:MAG TPA: glycosyltransferase family 4 protein [Candidatus Saccharimonadales bacterium]|nr:glycosyltransferase family 4 protein [Candidatus Saccharimonadales bacterium]